MTTEYQEYQERRRKRTHCDMPQSSPCHDRARRMADRLNEGATMRALAKEFYPGTREYESASTNIRGMLRKHGYVVDRREIVTVSQR